MHQPSINFLRVVKQLRARDPQAPAAANSLARSGDPDAQMLVGEFRLIGLHGPRNFSAGLKFITAAAEQGQPEAARACAYLTAAGIGRKANPRLARSMLKRLAARDKFAAVQLKLLDHVTCEQRVREVKPEVILSDPRVRIWRGLFNAAECGYLRQIGAPFMQPAMIVDGQTGDGLLDPVRQSDTTAIPMISEDLIVQAINRTIAMATGTETSQGEALTLLRYSAEQQYRPHYDAYDVGHPGPQRRQTAIIWLNGEYEGGETWFPRLNLTVRGLPGDMLAWDNLLADGARDDRMEHAGLPVRRGVKWLASRWITDTDLNTLRSYG